ELGGTTTVAVHLEPRRDQVQPAVRYAPLNAEIQRLLAQLPDASAVAHVETLLTDAGTIVILRCAFPPETPLSEVHNAMARLERDLRRVVPDVVRVQIDPEPAGDHGRKTTDERPSIAVNGQLEPAGDQGRKTKDE